MNHDYFALKIHETRLDDLQAEARHDRVARDVLRARRLLARLTTAASVLPFRPGDSRQSGVGNAEGRDAA